MQNKNTYGYSREDFSRFKKYAWLTLLSFGFMCLFFYNGRQNINLVLPLMKEAFQSDLGTLGIVSSALFWCYAFWHWHWLPVRSSASASDISLNNDPHRSST